METAGHMPLRGELREQEPMARHVTWRAGGPARLWYRPADLEDLRRFLAHLPEEMPVVWVGLGSNLLVRDGGFPGAVISLQGALDGMRRLEGARVEAQAGASCARLARFCGREGLVGAEFLAGIPGTLGGALAMNAGAFGGETWPLVEEVTTLDRRGNLHCRPPGEYRVGYRQVEGPAEEWFVAAVLRLEPGDAEAAQARIRELLELRNRSQPIGRPSCGSVFRNPPGEHAARLIEAAGLKGVARGAARVSGKHANFIINEGGATAAEIEGLMEEVRARVEERFAIRLEPEVRIIGEHADG